MIFNAAITGMGWVTKKSMGRPGKILEFENADELPQISRRNVLNQPYKPFGRMDEFSKLGFAAIAFALEDAGIQRGNPKKDIGLVAATSTGCIATDISYWQTVEKNASSPALFAYTLDSCFLGEASICFGLTHENYVINEKNSTGTRALYFALEQIGTGQCRAMVCGICNSGIAHDALEDSGFEPGALFFVLEPDGEKNLMTISADSDGLIYDQRNNIIKDMPGLARCLRPDLEIKF